MKRSSAMMLCLVLALCLMALHFVVGWQAAVNDAAMHGAKQTWGDYLLQWGRDTFENLQSEAWQLALQFALLAGLLKAIGVTAYEEDQETIKRELRDLRAQLEGTSRQ